MSAQKQKLALLLWSVTPEVPARCAAPFVYAAAAGAMDCEVELHFTGAAVRLLVPGVAEGLFSGADRDKSIAAFMSDASDAGAMFYACPMALRQAGLRDGPFIDAYAGTVGATAFVVRSLDPEWSTLVF
ncbi:MAG: DsrE family protein [Betaproteobacteria bacterium]|nr:DsrE family protein [Betaproteobacteria bacterium]